MATNSEGEATTEAAIFPQDEEEQVEGKADAQDSDAVLKNYDFEDEEKDSSQQQNGASWEEEGGKGEGERDTEKEQLVVLEEDGEKEHLGPRDEIKVTVTGYQRTADNCTFDVEVRTTVNHCE